MSDEMLALEKQILGFEKPQRRALKALKRFFHNWDGRSEKDARRDVCLGAMSTHLEDEDDLSLVAPPIELDRLTRLFEGHLAWMFRVCWSISPCPEQTPDIDLEKDQGRPCGRHFSPES